MGLEISLLDVSYEHERSSSSRLLPQFAVESVLNHNRARFFESGANIFTLATNKSDWDPFLRHRSPVTVRQLTRTFRLASRAQDSCYRSPGSARTTSTVFQAPANSANSKLERLREDDYLRYYEHATDQSRRRQFSKSRIGWAAIQISRRQRGTLKSLVVSSVRRIVSSKTALLYVARKSPLFDGRSQSESLLRSQRCFARGTSRFAFTPTTARLRTKVSAAVQVRLELRRAVSGS